MEPITNTQARAARWWGLAALLGIAGIFLPSLAGIDGFQGGFALSAFAVLVAIGGVVGAWVYRGRGRVLGALIDGDDLVARWSYGPGEWARWAGAEAVRDRTWRKRLFGVVAGISALVGLGFLAADRKAGLVVLAVLLGMLALIWIVSTLSARAGDRRREHPGEALIGTRGLWLAGQLHSWDQVGGRLEGAKRTQAEVPLIEIVYSFPTRQGRQETVVHLPVPAGQEAAADRVAAALGAAGLAAKR